MPSLVAADTLGVNELDGASAGRFAEMPASVRKRFDRERRQEISVQLSSLPAPVNEYSIVMPDVSAAMAEAEAAREQELARIEVLGIRVRVRVRDAWPSHQPGPP